MKLLYGLLASALNAEEDRPKFAIGGCHDWYWGDMLCKKECKIDEIGRSKKIKFKLKGESENILLAEAVANGNLGYQNKDKPYLGFLRFDKKFCSSDVLQWIGWQSLSVDIFDKTNDNYYVEAAHYIKPNGTESDLEAAIVQFRRGPYTKGELIFPKTKKDKFLFSMSNFYWMTEGSYEEGENMLDFDALKKCFSKVTVLTMKDDGEENKYGDYTKCYLYNRYGYDIDWEEEQEETTWSPGSTWSPGTTDEPPNTPDPNITHLIPPGTKCQGNAFSEATKIVGGEDAEKNSWPWIVGVRMGWGHSCGGTIINKNHVLTAAHCCAGFSASDMTVVVKDHDLNDASTIEIQAEEMFMHESYQSPTSFANDFCLLRTGDLGLDGQTADVACLPKQGEHVLPTNEGEGVAKIMGGHVGTDCFVGGWGTTSAGGSISSILQSVRVNIFSHTFCTDKSQYSASQVDETSEFCAGWMQGTMDSCQGDSGGPLICINDNKEPVLYGVVSWGYSCATPFAPGVYGKVSSIIDWLAEKIGSDEEEDDFEWETGPARLPAKLECKPPTRAARYATKGEKIVGGDLAKEGRWKWMADLSFGDDSLAAPRACQGTIISRNGNGRGDFVLTTGACCMNSDGVSTLDSVQVNVGQYNKNQADVGEFSVNGQAMYVSQDGAICLIMVPNLSQSQPDDCDDCWAPACLPANKCRAGAHCWVAGWGATKPGGNKSSKLRDVAMNIFDQKSCKNAGYDYDNVDYGKQFCAGVPDLDGDGQTDGGKGACAGDEGAPMICADEGVPVLYGIQDEAPTCGEVNKPSVFAKTFPYIDWISGMMDCSHGDASKCA